MRVGEIMNRKLLTIEPEADARAALQLMRFHSVRHLPVVQEGRLRGVISERDLGGPRAVDRPPIGRSVADLMQRSVVTATPRTTVRQAANLLRGNRVGCLPVIEDGRLVGIVTETDLLDLLGRGAEAPSPRKRRAILARRGARRRPTAVS